MAYYRKRGRKTGRAGYRNNSRNARRPARKASGRRARPAPQTIRIVVQQEGPSVANPAGFAAQKPYDSPSRARF